MSWLAELTTALKLVLVPFDGWQLDEPSHAVPADIARLADPMDPLAQSRLWAAIYRDLPRGYLVETCIVESGCRNPIGVHERDAHLGPSAWRGVWQRQTIAHNCPYYPAPADVDETWMRNASTRGNHGLMAAYNVQMIGDCVPLEALDIPFFSAWAAAEKSARACARLRAKHKPCTRERLRCHWAQARWGSKSCRKVIKRFKSALARHLHDDPTLDPRRSYSVAHFRRTPPHATDTGPDEDH